MYEKAKSNQWITEMALPLMRHLPSSELDGKLSLRQQDNCLVFFDDASYSGAQISEYLDTLSQSTGRSQPLDVYFVIPFISLNAAERMRQTVELATKRDNPVNIHLHLITTDTSIKTLREAFASNPKLVPLVGNRKFSARNCVALTEWKVPDSTSIPPLIHQTSDGKRLIVGQDRPYAAFSTGPNPSY